MLLTFFNLQEESGVDGRLSLSLKGRRDIPVLITPGHCPYPSWRVALQLAGQPGVRSLHDVMVQAWRWSH